MDAAQVFIANFGKMLPVAQPRRKIRGDDGLLDVIVIRAAGPMPALLAGWEALLQKDLGESAGGHVFRAQARKIQVRSDPARLVETDGSVAGKTPIQVVDPAAGSDRDRPEALTPRPCADARSGRGDQTGGTPGGFASGRANRQPATHDPASKPAETMRSHARPAAKPATTSLK